VLLEGDLLPRQIERILADPGLLEKFRKEALGASLLAVYGVWQVEGKVRHLITSKLVDRTELLGALPTTAREFC
jgi:error-prone DNA polymerase